MANKRPEKVFELVSFRRRSSRMTSRTTTPNGRCGASIEKRYLDGDEAKYTSSFNLAELPQAIRALQLAQEYVEGLEAEVLTA